VKSEPGTYSIDDLARDRRTHWNGVRNFKARNNMRAMSVGDEVLFYHSNANPSAVVGIARVCRTAYPDPDQFDRKSQYFDAKSDPSNPRWSMVDVEFVAKAKTPVTLADIQAEPALAGMELLRYSRLSVQSVTKEQFDRVKKMAGIR
jgi:predicted RNA-binding protein with PUA-like domain